MELLRAAITERLRLHPRVAQQDTIPDATARAGLCDRLPQLVPFRGRTLHDVIALLDWDHRLPSRKYTLRLHAFYGPEGVARFEAALAQRLADIQQKDLYPEFDVPDFADLPGDESYDVELTGELTVESMRLVSPWRREMDPVIGEKAAQVVRLSEEFKQARASEPARPSHLGDLEAVGWTPPCESTHAHWTVDVWWLTAFDGRYGRGWSFLVDLEASPPRVMAHREFTVRTG